MMMRKRNHKGWYL